MLNQRLEKKQCEKNEKKKQSTIKIRTLTLDTPVYKSCLLDINCVNLELNCLICKVEKIIVPMSKASSGN